MSETKKYPLRVLSVSFYGAPVAGAKQFSGALGRQKDYAQYLEQYIVVVPGLTVQTEHMTDYSDGLLLYALPARGYLSFFLAILRRVRALHAEYRFNMVFVDNPHIAGVLGVVVKYLLGLPLVVHSMADMPYNPWYVKERASNRAKQILIRIALAFTDFLRVSTHAEIARVVSCGFPKERVLHMPFYIDADAFRTHLAQVSKGERGNTVLFVGRLGPQKDLSTLLEAFAHTRTVVPDAHLVLVGDGPDRAMLEARADTLGITAQVTFTGAIPYEKVAEHFARAQLFAISSLYEGTCMVLHEAAVARLPLVATAFAGAQDFIRDGVEGYVVPVRDARALGARMAEVLQDKALAQRMGEASHTRVAEYSREYALSCWEALCRTLDTYVRKSQGR